MAYREPCYALCCMVDVMGKRLRARFGQQIIGSCIVVAIVHIGAYS